MAKVGRPRNFESPNDILEAFEEYKKEVKNNPRKKHVFVGKDGNSEYEILERPLTMEGFYCFCFERNGHIEQYFKNIDNAYSEFIPVCSRIKQEIRRDQIEGGMVGQYNASITQRLNGLREQVDQTVQQVEIFKGLDISVKEDNSAG